MLQFLALPLFTAAIHVDAQRLEVRLDPAAHSAAVVSRITLDGAGPFSMRLNARATIDELRLDGRVIEHRRGPDPGLGDVDLVELQLPPGGRLLEITYHARFEQDVASGERPGQIHNFSVDAHIGEDGIFLSDGSAWHPQPLDEHGSPILHAVSVDVTPLDGWAMVASGGPGDDGPLDEPRWRWLTPRPVEGMALVGNRHVLSGVVHETSEGPVEIVMHTSEANTRLAPLFIAAARDYLDIYCPLLGPFPYRRFSIVENFFSSGFAFPGFTLLGPQVVAMAPRSLAPGYLDHELIHNWWGNGVYVDVHDGNWCEALTSYCSNYYRRIADDGPDAGRAYRRGILMKLSSDPAQDDGPLGRFGSADPSGGGPGRFVGYDKGAFMFSMLADMLGGDEALWSAQRRLAEQHLGGRAGWKEIQACCEAEQPKRPAGWLDGFFTMWVREHHVPQTLVDSADSDVATAFARQYSVSQRQSIEVRYGPDMAWCEIDPDFRLYRVLPAQQIMPTIAGTLGVGGVTVETDPDIAAATSLAGQLGGRADGVHLMLVGDKPAARHEQLIQRTSDPITLDDAGFTVGGITYDRPDQSVLHTMQHPDEPGRFITVFHSNGQAGWSRLRLIRFYSRDTTVIWAGDRVQERRQYEPDMRVRR